MRGLGADPAPEVRPSPGWGADAGQASLLSGAWAAAASSQAEVDKRGYQKQTLSLSGAVRQAKWGLGRPLGKHSLQPPSPMFLFLAIYPRLSFSVHLSISPSLSPCSLSPLSLSLSAFYISQHFVGRSKFVNPSNHAPTYFQSLMINRHALSHEFPVIKNSDC